MLPRLEAKEAIALANRVAMGAGTLDEDTQRRLSADWARVANPEARRAAPATPQTLQSAGIAHRRVPKKTPQQPDA